MIPWIVKGKWAEGDNSSLIVEGKGIAVIRTFQFTRGKTYRLQFTVDGEFSARGGIRAIIGKNQIAVRGSGEKEFKIISEGGSGLKFSCNRDEFNGIISDIVMVMGS